MHRLLAGPGTAGHINYISQTRVELVVGNKAPDAVGPNDSCRYGHCKSRNREQIEILQSISYVIPCGDKGNLLAMLVHFGKAPAMMACWN